jgi:protein gp37
MAQFINNELRPSVMPRNIWLGVTVCNQAEAEEKIPDLLDTPAALRFISFEPLLGPVNLWRWFPKGSCPKPYLPFGTSVTINPEYENGIGWVIVGGETGPGARPMSEAWVKSLRDQCQAASVPFFFKGWHWGTRNGKKNMNRLLDGREWNEVPV